MLHQYVKSLHSYNPIPGGCVLYLPLWHPNLGGLKYKSIDPFGHTCTRTASGILHFDGSSNSSVDFGAIHDATDKLWVSFWFKLDAPFSSASPTTQELFAKYVNGTNYVYCYLDESDGKLYFKHGEGAGPETISSAETSWAADIWHHIIASMSTAAGQRMIVNGGTAVAGAGNQTAISLVASIVFGAAEVDSASYFVGEIKEVVMGTDDLSAPEEAALYAGTLPGDETEYWPMDEGSGTTINDQQGTNDADGTADSACTWENVPMHQRANGHYFDGFDDYINIDSVLTPLTTPTAGTIIMWIYSEEPNNTTAALISFGDTDADTFIYLFINNGLLAAAASSGGVARWSLDTDAQIDDFQKWSCVGIKHDGATPVLYFNGVAPSQAFINQVTKTHWIDNGITAGIDNARIGARSKNGGGNATWFEGKVGEVWIYDRNFLTTDFLYHYNQTKGRYNL